MGPRSWRSFCWRNPPGSKWRVCKRLATKKQRHEKEHREKKATLKINKHLKKMIKITMNHKDPDQSTDLLVVFEANDLGLYRGVEFDIDRSWISMSLFLLLFSIQMLVLPQTSGTMKNLDDLLEYIQIYITACFVSNIRVPNRTWNFQCILAHGGFQSWLHGRCSSRVLVKISASASPKK